MPHWNMEYQVLYEDCRKSLEVKSDKKIWFAECQKMTLGKGASSLSVRRRHSAKEPLCWVLGQDTQQRIKGGYQSLTAATLCRVLLFDTRQTWSLPSVSLCRVFGTRQTTFLPSAICLPSAFSLALGKQPLYRVSDKKHSTKFGTLGKKTVSGSEYSWPYKYTAFCIHSDM